MTLRFGKHTCKPLPHPPAAGAGSYGSSLETSREVPHQDEPTAATPISAHKQMAGHKHPGSIPHWHGAPK